MKKRNTSALIVLILASFIFGCSKEQPKVTKSPQEVAFDSALTAEGQANLTIPQIIQQFKDGNARFLKKMETSAEVKSIVTQTGTDGQFPKAVVLSCIDSRAPVEDICDKRIGDVFSCRVAGNYADSGVIGGIEFACALSGAKVIFVMGHTECGAIKGACDNAKLGNLTYVMNELKPAVDSVKGFDNDRTSKNKDFVKAVTLKNVELTTQWIKSKSQVLSDLIDQGKIKIVGAMYDVNTGKISFLN